MPARALVVALAILFSGSGLRAEFSAEKLALIDRPFQGDRAALSPDGMRLAYTKIDEGKLWLVIANLDTKSVKSVPLAAETEKDGRTSALQYLRWAGPDRILMVNRDGEIICVDAEGGNARRLWEQNDDGLVDAMYLRPEAYIIVAGTPRLLPPLADDPGHVLIESVATIGAESFSNPWRIDVHTGGSELVDAENYLSHQVALYGRGDMLIWPPGPLLYPMFAPPPTSVETPLALTYERPFIIRLRAELAAEQAGAAPLAPDTGAAVSPDSSATGRMLYDRQGHARILYVEDTQAGPREFLYTKPGEFAFEPNFPKPGLDKVLGQPKAKEFLLTASNYFSERSYPLAFDFDPNILYYASNVGRDTYGIYALNLATKERREIAPEIKGIDLATGDPAETDGILVFDEKLKKLVGIRCTTVRPQTYWLDPELGGLQVKLAQAFPRHSVEIDSWDETRQRFLLRVSSEEDPGGLFLYHRKDDRLEQVTSRTPWLATAKLNPAAPFSFRTPAGVELSGYLTLPNEPKLTPPPLMIYLQASLWDRAEPGFNRDTEMLADMGVVVMRLNYRGSPGFGRQHLLAIQEGIDTVPAEDLLAAIDWLASRTRIDRKRIMVMGESLGGYVALRALQLHPDVFQCAITINAPTSLSAWGWGQQIKTARPMFFNNMAEGTPTVDFQVEVRKQFVRQIKKAPDKAPAPPKGYGSRPMLVIESEDSNETTPLASILASLGLGARGVEVDHLWITGGFHEGTLETRTKVFQRIEEFLNANLYDYGATIGELKVVKEPPPPK